MIRDELVAGSDRVAEHLVAPPEDADDVCPTCRSWRNTDGRHCTNCTDASTQLANWCESVIPISLYRKPSQLRDWLKYYKPGDESDPEHGYREPVGLILGRFFLEHGDALQHHVGGFDAVCVVPSAQWPPPHELEGVYDEFVGRFGPQRLDLLERGDGEIRWRIYNDDAYRTTSDVAGLRLLVLDDVYTTGAHSQSAVSALTAAGATVPAVLVIARRVNPGFDEHVQGIWDRQSALGFDFAAPPFWRR